MKCELILRTLIVFVLMAVMSPNSEYVCADDAPSSSPRTSDNPLIRLTPQDANALCVVGKEIDTFVAPEFPRGIVSLRLYNCLIRDLESIRLLKNLRELHIRNCGLTDILPVGSLTKLSHLSLADNEITNVAPLANCRALASLDLRHNKIVNFSPLRVLDFLVRLDIRGNPFADGPERNDIRVIMQTNPAAQILLGADPNAVHGDMLGQLLLAKARIADFALFREWHYHDGYPNLPLVSDEIAGALLLSHQLGDQEYMSDVSVLLMRYAIHILATTHTGTLLNAKNAIVAEFLNTAPRHELAGDEITTGAVARWMRKNRNRIPASVILDAYLEDYQRLENALETRTITGTGSAPRRRSAD